MINKDIPHQGVRLFQSKLSGNIFANISLGEIVETETKTKTDDAEDYFGFCTVRKFPEGNLFRGVPTPFPMAGQSNFMGGFPLDNTMVILGWYSDRKKPIILGFLPYRYDLLLENRGTITDDKGEQRDNIEQLYPGEQLYQAAKKVATSSNNIQIPLGRMKLDKNGRIILSSQNKIVTIICGDQIDGQDHLTNSITNKTVVFRIECKNTDEEDAITLDVDEDGSYILKNSNDDHIVLKEGEISIESQLIKLGEDASQLAVLGTIFQTLYNLHIHSAPSGLTGPPTTFMNSTHLATKTKVE